jgi:hypothetical protein
MAEFRIILKRRRQKNVSAQEEPRFYQTSMGYTCRDHNLHNMNYNDAVRHFGLVHEMTIDAVPNRDHSSKDGKS